MYWSTLASVGAMSCNWGIFVAIFFNLLCVCGVGRCLFHTLSILPMRAAIPFLRVRLWTTNWSCRPRNQPNIEVFATLANIKLPHPQHNINHVHKRLWTSAYPNFKVVASHSDTIVYRNNIPSARSVLSPKHAVELLSWQLNRIYFNPAKGMVLVAETCWFCSSFEVMYIRI